MKNYPASFLGAMLLLLISCSSTKQSTPDSFFGQTWILEYIAVPDTSLDEIFPEKKPEITLDEETGLAVGNSGCNGYQAPYELDGSEISFGEPGPSTLMYCGEGENQFRKTIRQVDQWRYTKEGMLEFLSKGVPVLRFAKAGSELLPQTMP